MRVILSDGFSFPHIEFEVYLSKLSLEGKGQDVTVNWQWLDVEGRTDGTFYHDSNAYKIMRRKTYVKNNYDEPDKKWQVASEMYPVNSGIMIEDSLTGEFMLVMNDRP